MRRFTKLFLCASLVQPLACLRVILLLKFNIQIFCNIALSLTASSFKQSCWPEQIEITEFSDLVVIIVIACTMDNMLTAGQNGAATR